jgi:protocatechuate 3,4-dioxygenase beta subunit
MNLNRSEFLSKCAALGVLTFAPNISVAAAAHAWSDPEKKARIATPQAEFGPFYKREAPNIATLRAPNDPGLPLAIAGAIYNTRGELLPGAKIEVWQTNHSGHYDLQGYRYRATLLADPSAGYQFTSVMPGHYPARVCQHVHFAVTAAGHQPLITQMYFATDPVFAGDPDKNYAKDPLITSRELVRPVMLSGEPQAMIAAVKFEMVLAPL